MYSACSLLLFCFEPTVRHLDDLSHCYGKFFRKLLDHSYVQSSYSTITRHIENSILKDTLQLNNLRTGINIRVKSFIKASVNIVKQKSMKTSRKISVTGKSKCTLRRTLPLDRPRFTYCMRFLFFFLAYFWIIFNGENYY